jgi:hypothetical protein
MVWTLRFFSLKSHRTPKCAARCGDSERERKGDIERAPCICQRMLYARSDRERSCHRGCEGNREIEREEEIERARSISLFPESSVVQKFLESERALSHFLSLPFTLSLSFPHSLCRSTLRLSSVVRVDYYYCARDASTVMQAHGLHAESQPL